MPRIVPLQLLKCLRVLLDTNGGILSATEVKRIAGLMTKYSKKLVSKCVYVQILKSTKTELLGDFMTVGGWGLVCTWLGDAIRTMNWPLVQEILELLLLSPVDVNRLKINSAPILVKGLCKDGGNEGVRILAKRLVEQWLKIVTENPGGTTATGSSGSAAESMQSTSKESSSAAELKDSNMENSSSDSTDSGCGGSVTQNYRIISAERKRAIVLTIKTVDKSSASTLASTHSVYNDDDSSLPPSEAGSDSRGTESNANLDCSDKSNLDDSCTTDSKVGDEADKKHKNARGDKSNKRSEKDREKDRKSSSSSHRSSSSSHKSSSSSSSKGSSKSSSSSSHRSSSSDKHRDKDKVRSGSSSSKEKDRKDGGGSSSSSSSSKHKSSKSSNSSSSSSNSSTSSKDRSRDKDKEKSTTTTTVVKKENEKDNKLMPPPPASLPDKKSKEGTETADVQSKPKSIPIPNRKASISIEIRRDTEKTSTVKTYQSKFRSHGLTEEAPPPPSRKGLKKPTSTALPSANSAGAAVTSSMLPISSGLKRLSPPPRETPAEKKPKIDMTHVSGHVERPGSAKLIAPKKRNTASFCFCCFVCKQICV
ncbi:uncharacterized protein DDB_G0271670 isoform X2 [Drosophila grimshawi]|uniref:uncharacterized protein DDB_G0271670 isoform X2 n=1 Tax=Drosophila grimshawi TaxID=7222 RepID=UPI001C9356D4|nr:uncharacterized protein DDB_G0271670 isoform X2 [Drosophila grimshawi]